MGLGPNSLRFLLSTERLGLCGTRAWTLGRQAFGVTNRQFHALLKEHSGRRSLSLPANRAMYFADDVFLPLSYHVDSMDASDCEGANIVHDLNLPIPHNLREKFDLVWDSGTLQLVFNFPTAILNVLQMVGSFLGATVPNFMHSLWFRGCHGRGRSVRIAG